MSRITDETMPRRLPFSLFLPNHVKSLREGREDLRPVRCWSWALTPTCPHEPLDPQGRPRGLCREGGLHTRHTPR